MTVTDATETSLLSQPHHDGSYVLEAPDELGGEAVVRLRVPRGTEIDGTFVRYVCDGQPRVATGEIDEETDTDVWWTARFEVENPTMNYRWLLRGAEGGNRWLNGLGTFAHTVADADDFVITVAPPGPDWHLGSVVYEIFPDRFASSGAEYDAPGLGGAARLGRAPGRALEVAVRVVRRRPARHRGAARPHRVPRRVGRLSDADLPRRHHPPLRREHLRAHRPAAGRGRGPRHADEGRSRAGHPRRRRPDPQPCGLRPRLVPDRGRRPRVGRARLLLLRRVASERLRRVDGGAAPPQARLPLAGAPAADERRRRPLDEAALRARRVAHRRGEHDRALPRHRRQPRGGARDAGSARLREPGRALRRRAHARRPVRPRRPRLAGRHELFRLPRPDLGLVETGPARGRVLRHDHVPPARRPGRRRDDAVPLRRPLACRPALMDAPLEPRCAAARDRHTFPGTPRGGDRDADDDAWRPDALRRRRDRARRRVGRGRAPDDALGSPRHVGREPAGRVPPADCAATLVAGARARRDQVRVGRLRRARVPARDARGTTALPGRAGRVTSLSALPSPSWARPARRPCTAAMRRCAEES